MNPNGNDPQIYSKDSDMPSQPLIPTPESAPEEEESVREIDLDEEESLPIANTNTPINLTENEPAQTTTPPINQKPVTEIAIDDEEVNKPTESFTQTNQTDPNQIPSPETGLNKTETELNDEEQRRRGGGEVTLNTVSTYQDAVKEALRTQSMSGAKMLMAEQRKRDARQEDEERDSIRTPINKLYLTIAIFFIILAIGAFFAVAYFNNQPQEEDTQRAIRETFFQPDSVIEVPQAQLGRNTILKIQQVLGSPVAKRGVQQVVVTKEVAKDPTSAVQISIDAPYTRDDFFALTESRVTDGLRRSLSETVFLGIEAAATNEPFLLYQVVDYNSSFAGMLAWERTLIRDMSKIFSKGLGEIVLDLERQNAIIEQQNLVARAASSTAPTIPIQTITSISVFEDEVIANTDARVIRDSTDNIVFFYTFINNEYLFLGTSQRTLTEIQKKIRSAKLVL